VNCKDKNLQKNKSGFFEAKNETKKTAKTNQQFYCIIAIKLRTI